MNQGTVYIGPFTIEDDGEAYLLRPSDTNLSDFDGMLMPPLRNQIPAPAAPAAGLVEAIAGLDWVIEVASWENADAHDALLRVRAILDALAGG